MYGAARNPYGPKADKMTTIEKAFVSLLSNTMCESLEHALGPDVLQILLSKGLLDNAESPDKIDSQLRSIFFDGAKVLERLMIKDLYRKLGIPYSSDAAFDYSRSIRTAKDTCLSLADQVLSE